MANTEFKYTIDPESLEFKLEYQHAYDELKHVVESIVDNGVISHSFMLADWQAVWLTKHGKQADLLVLSTVFPIKAYQSLLRYSEMQLHKWL